MRPVNFGQMWYWPNVVLAKCGQIRMAKTGLAKCGRDSKKSHFFSLSRYRIRSFLPSLGVFSLNFGGVFEGRDPQMCTFGLSFFLGGGGQ